MYWSSENYARQIVGCGVWLLLIGIGVGLLIAWIIK